MEEFLKQKLEKRKKKGQLRVLPKEDNLIDFLSNDYLGLARNKELSIRISESLLHEGFVGNGGSGSRLLSGNHRLYEKLETKLAELFQSESTLVFNSGYAANQALVSSVAGRTDTILYDKLSHVCLKEGAWLSRAQSHSFEHNNLIDLESKLANAKGRKFVIVESVYSMDGDEAPIENILKLCRKYEGLLIVDEAHSTGIFGRNGSGYLVEKGLERDIFARIYTFGKAMGVHGACVAGSKTLIDYLTNFGRPFVYTTSLPPHSILSIYESFKYVAHSPELKEVLISKIKFFKSLFETHSTTAIQPIIVPGSQRVRDVAKKLRNSGFNVLPIVAPTVQEGEERLRICLHTFNSDEEILKLTENLKKLL